MEKQKLLKYLVIDVDGTLTDGGIYYDERGNELKKFCTKDAAGFFVAREAGIDVVVLTSRECLATTRRLTEMGVKHLHQNVKDKAAWMDMWMKTEGICKDEIGYIGDDLNDLLPMKLCAWVGCPANACSEIKNIADYVSSVKGGEGAVRDIIEHYFREQGIWNELIKIVYGAKI